MKTDLNNLVVFGGTPEFSEKLHVGRPNIGNRERLMERINDMLDRRWLTNRGPYVQELEQRIAEYIGAKHCIAMCNATIALEVSIRALGLSGEVIVPSFTFIATAHALQWQQIRPVFCDIDPLTYNIDPTLIEELITPRTTGILGVHVWGRPCNIEALSYIATKHHLKLLYDAAHAVGCSYKGQMIGNFGDAEVFSFHATKFFNSFEGGMVVTNNDELADKIRLMSNFGFSGVDNVIFIGTNSKMTEVAAAMGLTSFESLDDFVSVNYRNYCQYHKELDQIPGIQLVTYNEKEKNNFQYMILEVDEQTSGLSRDDLVRILWAENVLVRRYFYPGCHKMEPYRTLDPQAGRNLPHTERLTTRALSLPNGTSVGADEIHSLCNLIRFTLENAKEIKARMVDLPEFSLISKTLLTQKMDPLLPTNWNSRPPIRDDLEVVTQLLSDCDIADFGFSDTSIEDMRVEWQRPGFDSSTGAVLLTAPDGRLAAYFDIYLNHEGKWLISPNSNVHPDYRNILSYRSLYQLAETKTLLIKASKSIAEITLKTVSTSDNKSQVLEEMGYTAVRWDWRMEIDIDHIPEPPSWPEGFVLRDFKPERDKVELHQLIQDAFRDIPNHTDFPFEAWDTFMFQRADYEPELVFIVERKGQISAAAFCYDYLDLGWVRQLAVKKEFRGQGLGYALLINAFQTFYYRGRNKIGLVVDSNNPTGAPELYRRAGMHPVASFVTYEKKS